MLFRLCVLAPFFLPGLAIQPVVEEALQEYNNAFRAKDVAAIRNLLAEDVLLYEHSVKNDGIEDVYGHHLKPEIEAFEGLQLDFSDVRITQADDMALVTRDYKVKGKLGERMIDAKGNETMVWRQINGNWKIIHIHYSHPCPRSP